MTNFVHVIKEEPKEHDPNWSQIPDSWMLIIGGCRSGRKSSLFNLINKQPDIDRIYLYAKDPYKAKYQSLINKRGSTGLKLFNDSKAFIECSSDLDDISTNIEEYIPNKKRRILIFFLMIWFLICLVIKKNQSNSNWII